MSQQNSGQQSAVTAHTLIIILLCVILVILGIFFFVVISDIKDASSPSLIQLFPIGEPMPDPDRSAEQAVESVNLLLGFIQAGSVIIGIAAVGAVSAGFLNARELRQKVDDVEKLRDDVKKDYDNLRASIALFESLPERVERDIKRSEKLREDLDREIPALSRDFNARMSAFGELSLAQRQIQMNNLPEAIQTLIQAQTIAKDENSFICYVLGDTLARQGRLDEGIKYLEKAIKIAEDNNAGDTVIDDNGKTYYFYDAQVSLAYAKRMKGDRVKNDLKKRRLYLEAEEIFSTIANKYELLQDISGESAFGALAGLYRRQEKFEKAIYWYENAERATPGHTYPVNNLAQIYFVLGNDALSISYFERSKSLSDPRRKLDPSNIWSYFDYVTAKIGLRILGVAEDQSYTDEIAHEDAKEIVKRVYATTRSEEPLDKFKGGLTRLLEREDRASLTEEAKTLINRVIKWVDDEAEISYDKENNTGYAWIRRDDDGNKLQDAQSDDEEE